MSRRILWAACAITVCVVCPHAPAADASGPLSPPLQGREDRLDEEAFRRGLCERGLFELLDLYDREHPAGDEVGRLLRRREALLRRCDDPNQGMAERGDACRQAIEVLAKLLAENPSHADRFRWQVEISRDFVERQSAVAVEALLFRVASPKQREEIAATGDRAIARLQQLAAEIAAEWQRIGSLPPEQFERLSAANRLQELESIEAAGAYLLAWARLYRAMVLPAGEPRRADLLGRVTEEAVGRRHWTEQPHEKTGLQMQALVLVAIAQRLAGKTDLADAASQQAVTIYSRMEDPQQRRKLDAWALLAVLERIRLLRDHGETGEALAAIGRAYEWARKTRPDDVGAVVALAVLGRSISAGQPVENDPLPSVARANAEARPLIYESLGRLVQEQGGSRATGPLEKLALAWVLAEDAADPDEAARITRSLSDTKDDAFVAAEGLFLLARCEAARSRPAPAARALIRLLREHPSSDRAATAIDEAVRLAVQAVASTTEEDRKRWKAFRVTSRATTQPTTRKNGDCPYLDARETLVQAVRLLREKSPDSARLPGATFAAGVALEQVERWHDGAGEFARVPVSHDLAAEAALRRARCLTRNFESKPDEPNAAEAIQAATEARQRIETIPESKRDACWVAEAVLLCAGVQAHPAVDRRDAALATLADFETRYAACAGLLGPMWHVRLIAMESLGHLKEANAYVDRALAAEPERAGPVMIRLLARMREKIEHLQDEGDAGGARDLAVEAAQLAEKLERWGSARSTSAPVDGLPAGGQAERLPAPPGRSVAIASAARLARAMALLDADRTDEACGLAEEGPAKDIDWQFVRAECLYRAKSYREALPMFHQVWQSAEAGGRLWWRALLRNLQCHTEIGTDPDEILQSIRQHQYHHEDMGGPAMRREFRALERRNEQRKAGR